MKSKCIPNHLHPLYYFDGTHLVCEDESCLHYIAGLIGLKQKYFQNKKHGISHYDVWGRPKKKLLSWGNIEIISTRKLIKLARQWEALGEGK